MNMCDVICSSYKRRGQQEEAEPEEDLTKDMEDPTPVPNMEEVKLPKNGVCLYFCSLQSVCNDDTGSNTLLDVSLIIVLSP